MKRLVLAYAAPRVYRIADALRRRHRDLECLPLPTSLLRTSESTIAQLARPERLQQFDIVVFVSPGAVHAFFEIAGDWPVTLRCAAIGPATAEALQASPAGKAPVIRPDAAPYDAAALLRMPPFDQPAGLRILVVRGEDGRDDWIERLAVAGADVALLAAYRSEAQPIDAAARETLRQWLGGSNAPVFAFSTGSAAEAVSGALAEESFADAFARCTVFAIHPRIAARLRALGWQRVHTIAPGEDALAAAIESA